MSADIEVPDIDRFTAGGERMVRLATMWVDGKRGETVPLSQMGALAAIAQNVVRDGMWHDLEIRTYTAPETDYDALSPDSETGEQA